MAETGPWNDFAAQSDGPWNQFKPTTSGKIPQKEMGAAESFMAGVQDPIVGGKQLITHITKSPEEAAKVDLSVRNREQQLQQAGVGPVMRGVGGMVGTLPAMAAGPLGPVLGGAIGGAASGAVQPATGQGDYWTQKTDDAMFGAAFGVGAGSAASVLGGILGGPSGAAKTLMQSGVQLTPGQMAGGVVRRAEEAFKSLPILGSFIRGAEGRGIEGFNRGIANQVLEPIGQKVPANASGRDLVRATETALGNAYDKVLPNIKLRVDQDFTNDLINIRGMAAELPNAQKEQFENILKNRVAGYFRQSPVVNQGAALKQTMSDIRQLANGYRGSGSTSERMLAYRLDDVNAALRKAMIRQNPQFSDDLRKVDAGWAMFTRMQDASTRRATSEGTFTPADLLQTIKSKDKSVRHGSFARGDELLQVYAQYGQKILPGKLPDSGTTERALYDAALLAAGYGAETGHVSMAVPAALAAGSLPYTGPGMAVINKAMAAGPGRQVAGSVVRKAAPYAGIGSVPYGTQNEPEYGGPQQ